VACVRVQARDPDALANVRIAYGLYARRCGVCADRTSDEARVSGRSVRSVTVALNYNLDVGTRSLTVESVFLQLAQPLTGVGARDTASGLGYTRFFFLRTTVLQHE